MDMVESHGGMHHGNMSMDNSTMNPIHDHNTTGHRGSMDHGDHASGPTGGHHGTVYFNFQLPIQVLFFGWNITDQGLLAASCVGVLFLSILYEGLKSLRQLLFRRSKCPRDFKFRQEDRGCVNIAKKMFNGWHFLQSILQIIQTTLGMFLMLIYMTFNVWLAVSISLGSGVGYFLFSWNKQSFDPLDEDHCG